MRSANTKPRLQHLPEGVPEGVLYPISLRVDLAQIYRDAGDDANADRVTKDAAKEISCYRCAGPDAARVPAPASRHRSGPGQRRFRRKRFKRGPADSSRATPFCCSTTRIFSGKQIDRKKRARPTARRWPSIHRTRAHWASLGFVSREMGDNEAARNYFLELEKKHPDDYVPYLALGDLYSATRQFPEAQASYEQAFKRAPSNPLIVSGAMNAALEATIPAQAKEWLARASEAVQQNPQVMREHERYLTMTGNYAESADLGYQVIEKLPKDREAVDYLAYDLLFLKRLDEAMKIVERYQPILKDDRDLYLIAGYVHADHGENEDAVEDFTRALEIDPQMAVGYMNRGLCVQRHAPGHKGRAGFPQSFGAESAVRRSAPRTSLRSAAVAAFHGGAERG